MTPTQAVQPSLWWAALAFPVSLAGLALAVFFMVTEIERVGSSMAYANVPGEMDVDLKRNLSYTVFLEQTLGESAAPSSSFALRAGVLCELHTLPYGDAIPMSVPSGSTTYNYGDRSGISFLHFTVPRDGTYLLGCRDNRGKGPPLRIAVGSGAEEAIVTAIERSLVSFFGGGLVALLIFVRVLMLRDQSKRAIRAQGMKPV